MSIWFSRQSCIYLILSELMIVLFLSPLHGSIEENLAKIPQEDQRILTEFFHYLVTESSFAYTLFGNKPLSFEEFSENLNKNTLENLLYPYADSILGDGWVVWEKYQHLFTHPQFAFKKVSSRSGYTFILLVNKKALLNAIRQYLEDFRFVLGHNKSAHQLVEDIINTKYPCFEDSIANHQLLLGILLGYGRENSSVFFERDQICKQLAATNSSPILCSFHSINLISSTRQLLNLYEKHPRTEWQKNHDSIPLSLLCKKLENIERNTEAFTPRAKHWINKIGAPEFLSLKNGPERDRLEKNYQETLALINKIHLTQSLLSTILQRLTDE